jgi:Glycosyl hydrolase family 71.
MKQELLRQARIALFACVATLIALAPPSMAAAGPEGAASSAAERLPAAELASAPRAQTADLVGSGSVAALRSSNAATWPFDPPPLEAMRDSSHKIFAHWHGWPISLDNKSADDDYWQQLMRPDGDQGRNSAGGGFSRERPLPRSVITDSDWEVKDMETEVRRASAVGLDGFMFNIVNPQAKGLFKRLLNMLDAAQAVDPGFKVALMIDAVTNEDRSVEDVAAGIVQVANHPAVYRMSDGRLLIAAFTADRLPVDWWQDLFKTLKKTGIKVYFMPVFQGWRDKFSPFTAISDGLADWGDRSLSGFDSVMPGAAAAHELGKIWMSPVSPQLFRPKKNDLFYKEAGGSTLFRETWRVAREGGADWVQIITWNDYGEGTEIAPSTGIQYAFYDLTGFYGTWFKTGQQPPITRDVLYYFHRIMPTDTPADLSKQARMFQIRGIDPPQDIIELLAFLTEPGTLEIEIGGKTFKQEATAGITSFKIPIAPGRPRFRLVRDGTTVIDFESAFDIRMKTVFQDFLYRAGSSSRPPIQMIANPPVPQ